MGVAIFQYIHYLWKPQIEFHIFFISVEMVSSVGNIFGYLGMQKKNPFSK